MRWMLLLVVGLLFSFAHSPLQSAPLKDGGDNEDGERHSRYQGPVTTALILDASTGEPVDLSEWSAINIGMVVKGAATPNPFEHPPGTPRYPRRVAFDGTEDGKLTIYYYEAPWDNRILHATEHYIVIEDVPGYRRTVRHVYMDSADEFDLGTIELHRTWEIEARVLDPSGEPMPGMGVIAVHDIDENGVWPLAAETDEDGIARIDDLWARRVHLRVQDDDNRIQGLFHAEEPRDGSRKTMTLQLEEPGSIVGRVRGELPISLSVRELSAFGDRYITRTRFPNLFYETLGHPAYKIIVAVDEETGAFEIPDVAPGAYRLWYGLIEWPQHARYVEVSPGEEAEVEVDGFFPHRIHARFLGQGGWPIVDAKFTLYDEHGHPVPERESARETLELRGGRLNNEFLLRRQYDEVSAKIDAVNGIRYRMHLAPNQPDEPLREIRLPEVPEERGTLELDVDFTRLADPGLVRVEYTALEFDAPVRSWGSTGNWDWPRSFTLIPGRYQLHVACLDPVSNRVSLPPFEIGAGETVNLTATLGPRAELRVQLLDPDGLAPRNARIQLSLVDTDDDDTINPTKILDQREVSPTGAWRHDNLREGVTYELKIEADGFEPQRRQLTARRQAPYTRIKLGAE